FLSWAAARARLGMVVPAIWLLHRPNLVVWADCAGTCQVGGIWGVLVLSISLHGVLVVMASLRGVLWRSALLFSIPPAHEQQQAGDDGKRYSCGSECSRRNHVSLSSLARNARISLLPDSWRPGGSTGECRQSYTASARG